MMSKGRARCTEAELRRAAKVAKEIGYVVEVLPDRTVRLSPPVDKREPPVQHVREFSL